MVTPERIVPTKTGFYVLLSNDELVPVTDLFDANGERVEHLGDAVSAVAGPVSFPDLPNTKWVVFALPPAHKAH